MARYLDTKKYKWIKNTKRFPYTKISKSGQEIQAQYVPDFYLIDLDLWVETKGYETENDKRKIQQFPFKIRLIGRKEIFTPETWGF